jgi:hypothetical protein
MGVIMAMEISVVNGGVLHSREEARHKILGTRLSLNKFLEKI